MQYAGFAGRKSMPDTSYWLRNLNVYVWPVKRGSAKTMSVCIMSTRLWPDVSNEGLAGDGSAKV